MLTVTERAAEMLEQVRTANATSLDQAVRLTPGGRGGIGITLDALHTGARFTLHHLAQARVGPP